MKWLLPFWDDEQLFCAVYVGQTVWTQESDFGCEDQY